MSGSIGMMGAVELVQDQASRKPAIGPGGRVVDEAMKRGLVIRQRGGGGTPASGAIIGYSITAAT
jgi:4-aminobutyrate aminotransferase-like enzyme